MKYTELQKYLENNDIKSVRELLDKSPKNEKITIYKDYYDGNHWQLEAMGSTTKSRTARSGRVMWKVFDDKKPWEGFTEGELKTWNWARLMVDTYARYGRGSDTDDVVIQIKDRADNTDGKLSTQASEIFGDLNQFTIRAITVGSVTSVIPVKYTPLEDTKDVKQKSIVKLANMLEDDAQPDALVSFIDPRELEPLYWEGVKRGYIRYYKITTETAQLLYPDAPITKKKGKKEHFYMEIWQITDNAKLKVNKYIDDVMVDEITDLPYKYLPYHIEANKKDSFGDFSYNYLEVSDVANILEVQDDINAFLTDLTVIYRQVALPMLKLTDEFVKNAKKGDFEKVEQIAGRMNTMAGTLIMGPIEKMGATGPADTHVKHLQDLIEQLQRETGIPKSVNNSEGLANIATETLDHLMQSLHMVVGEKRTAVTNLITAMVKMHLKTIGKWQTGYTVKVTYPDMYQQTKNKIAELVTMFFRDKLLPRVYAVNKAVELLGDGENAEEIMAQFAEEDATFKLELEQLLNQQTEIE